jgi:hypothetical protein
MAPIPNPEDLPPAERARIYGPHAPGRQGMHGGPGHPPLKTWRGANGHPVVAMRPIPNPEDMSAHERHRVYGNRYAPYATVARAAPPRHRSTMAGPVHTAAPVHATAPVHAAAPIKAAPPPVVHAAAPPPVIKAAPPVMAAVKPVAPPVVTPVVAPKPPMDPKLAKLQAAVGPAATNGAAMTVADTIAKGQPGKVTLTLSQDLYATIKREAGKAGVAAAAKKTDISALLSGEGYTITPNGVQTVHLGSGEAPVFEWMVTPLAGVKGPLKAQIDATLAGIGKPQTFSLATIEQAIKSAIPDAPQAKASSFSLDFLSIPGMKDVNLPVVGKVASKSLVAGLIVLILLLIIAMVVRGSGAAKARDERRRKFRTLTDYGLNSDEAEPVVVAPSHTAYAEPATYSPPPPEVYEAHPQTNYVNPMIAAAAGAAAGAAVTHAVDEHAHDAHAHAEDAHVEEAHPEHGHAPEVHAEEARAEPAHGEHREPEHA